MLFLVFTSLFSLFFSISFLYAHNVMAIYSPVVATLFIFIFSWVWLYAKEWFTYYEFERLYYCNTFLSLFSLSLFWMELHVLHTIQMRVRNSNDWKSSRNSIATTMTMKALNVMRKFFGLLFYLFCIPSKKNCLPYFNFVSFYFCLFSFNASNFNANAIQKR